MNAPEKALIPSLRFPEFSGAWEEKRLGELAIFASGGTPSKKKDEYWSGHIPWISASSMHSDVIDRSELMVTDLGAQNGTKLAATGALLLLVRGSMLFNRIPAGICARDVVFNQDVKLLIASPETTEHFILLQIRSKEHRLLSLVVGTGIGAGKIDTSELEIFSMPIPPLPEQQKIADYLGAVDAKLRLLERRRDALTAYKKGMMQRIFAQEIRFTQEDGTAFPDWQKKQLGDLANVVGGGTPSTDKSSYWDGGISWFTPSEIKSKYLDKSARTLSSMGLKKSSAKLLPSGTLLLSTRANVGDIGIATSECATNQGFQSLIVKIDQSNEYWYYWIVFNKRKFIRWAAGSTFLEINKREVSKIIVDTPHPDEQQKIADFLSAIDDKITAATRHISAMKDFKKSMLQQMFV